MTLDLQNVGRCIGNQWIVRHLSFQIGNDECLALVGPSGCGKSTTLRLIAGLDPVSEGSIAIGGHDVTAAHTCRTKHWHGVPELCVAPSFNRF